MVLTIAHKISHGTNVVVNNQSANSKKDLLLFDWMLTMTTFVPWDILWTMLINLLVANYRVWLDCLSHVLTNVMLQAT